MIGMQAQGGTECKHPQTVRVKNVSVYVHHGYLTSPVQHPPKVAMKMMAQTFALLEHCAAPTCEKVLKRISA